MLNMWCSLLYFISMAIVGTLLFFLNRKELHKTNIFFLLVIISSLSGLMFGGINYLVKDESIRILFHELKQINLVFSPPFYFLYLYKFFYGNTEKLRCYTWLLIGVSFSFFVIILTNPYHHLFKALIQVEYRSGYSMVTTVPGILFFPISLYQLGLYFCAILITANNLKRYREMGFKNFMLILLMGSPFLLFLVYNLFSGLSNFDYATPLTPVVLTVAFFFLERSSFGSIVPIVKESIINRITLPLFALNSDHVVVFSNDAARRLLAIENAGRMNDFFGRDDQYRLFNEKNVSLKGKCYNIDYGVVKDKMDHIISHIFILTDISQMQHMMKELEHISYIDPLTGLYNRRYLFEEIDYSVFKKSIAVSILDIDNFKEINDTHGHVKGDYFLRLMAQILKENIDDKGFGTTGRFGGDEFLFVLFDVSENQLENLIKKIQSDFKEMGQSASFGYVIESKDSFKSLDALIGIADERMYNNKQKMKAGAVQSGS